MAGSLPVGVRCPLGLQRDEGHLSRSLCSRYWCDGGTSESWACTYRAYSIVSLNTPYTFVRARVTYLPGERIKLSVASRAVFLSCQGNLVPGCRKPAGWATGSSRPASFLGTLRSACGTTSSHRTCSTRWIYFRVQGAMGPRIESHYLPRFLHAVSNGAKGCVLSEIASPRSVWRQKRSTGRCQPVANKNASRAVDAHSPVFQPDGAPVCGYV